MRGKCHVGRERRDKKPSQFANTGKVKIVGVATMSGARRIPWPGRFPSLTLYVESDVVWIIILNWD